MQHLLKVEHFVLLQGWCQEIEHTFILGSNMVENQSLDDVNPGVLAQEFYPKPLVKGIPEDKYADLRRKLKPLEKDSYKKGINENN